MMNRVVSCGAALTLLAAAAPAAAQYVNPDTCSMADFSCQQANQEKSKRSAVDYEEQAKHRAQKEKAEQERRRALLKAPPLPAERNALLGSWRLDAGERSTVGGPGQGSGRDAVVRELMGALSMTGLKEIACAASYSGDMSFAPSTYAYSVRGRAGSAGGPIAYRAALLGGKPAIAAIPGDSRQVMMVFASAGPDRIVAEDGCTLVRVGAPAYAALNAPTAPGQARAGIAGPSAPPTAGAVAQGAAAAGVVDGAAFRCGDGRLLHVSLCQGNADDATCKLTELHLPGLQIGKPVRRAEIAARVRECESGGIRYGADDKPVFVR